MCDLCISNSVEIRIPKIYMRVLCFWKKRISLHYNQY